MVLRPSTIARKPVLKLSLQKTSEARATCTTLPWLPAGFAVCYHPRVPEFIRGGSASNQGVER
jgi:hypothetical protein